MKKYAKILCAILIVASLCASLLFTAGAEEAVPFEPSMKITKLSGNQTSSSGSNYKSNVSGNRVTGISVGNTSDSSFITMAEGEGENPWIVAYANKSYSGSPSGGNNLYISAGTSNSDPFTVIGAGAKGYYVIDFDIATHGDMLPGFDISVPMRRASDTSGFPFSDEIYVGGYVTEKDAWTHVTLLGDIKNNVVKVYLNGEYVGDADGVAVRTNNDSGVLANDTKVVAQGFRIEFTRNNAAVNVVQGQNVAFDNLAHRLFIEGGAELETALSDGDITDWSAYTNGRGGELLPTVAVVDGVEHRNFSNVNKAFNSNDTVNVEFLALPIAPIELCANANINTNGMDYTKIFTPVSGCKIESVDGNFVKTSAPFVSNYQETNVVFSGYNASSANIPSIYNATKGNAEGNLYDRFNMVSATSLKNLGTLGYRNSTIITDTVTGTTIYRESAYVSAGATTTKEQNEYSNFNFTKVELSYEEGKNEYIVIDFDFTYDSLDGIFLQIIPRGSAGYHATSLAVKNLPVNEGEMVHITAVHDFTDNVAYYFVNGVLTNTVNGGAINSSAHSKYLSGSEQMKVEEYKLGSNSISTLYFANMNIRFFDVDASADTIDAAIDAQDISCWDKNIYTSDYQITQFPAIATVDGVAYHTEQELEAALYGNRKTPSVVKVLHAFDDVITVNCDATVYTYGQNVSFVDANGKSLTPDRSGVIRLDIPYMPARIETPVTVVGGANAADVYDAIKYSTYGNLFSSVVHSNGKWGSAGYRNSSLIKNLDTADVLYRNAAILNANGGVNSDSTEYVDMKFTAQTFTYSAGTNAYLVVDFDFATDGTLKDDVSVVLGSGAEPLVLKNLGILDGDTAHVTIVYDFTNNYAYAFVNGLFACSVEGGAAAGEATDVTVDSFRLSTAGKTSSVCLDNVAIRAFSYATAEDTLAGIDDLGDISTWEESIYNVEYKMSKIPTLAVVDGREYGSIDTLNKILAIETSYAKSVELNYIPESDIMIKTEVTIETNGLNVPLNWNTGLYEFDPGIDRYRGTRTGLAYASTKFVYTTVGTAYTFRVIDAENCWSTCSIAVWTYKVPAAGQTLVFQDYDVVFYPYGEKMEPIEKMQYVEGNQLHTFTCMELQITSSTSYNPVAVSEYPVANSNESLKIYYLYDRKSNVSYAATDILYSANVSTDIELVLYVNKSQTLTNTGNVVTIDGKEYVAFTYKLAPHEIDKVITVSFEVANSALIYTQKQDICFVDYARALLEGSYEDKALIVSLLNYANEAHALFDANGEKMPAVTELVNEYAQYLPTEELTAKLDTSALSSIIRSASLRLNSTPEFVFKIARGFRGTVTVSYTGVNGLVQYSVYVNTLSSEQNITIKGMSIAEFTNDLTISVVPHGQDTPIECQYNLATYAHGLEDNAFAVALYNYSKAAAAHLGIEPALPVA